MQRMLLKRRLMLMPELYAKRITYQYGDDVGSGKVSQVDDSA